MKDLVYAFTLCFMALGPLKTIPAFFLATHGADRRTVLILAAKSTVLATLIVLFVNLVASGTLMQRRVSLDALALAGGFVLLVTSVKTLSGFNLIETPARTEPGAAPASTGWMGRPVLSPLVIPGIIPPIGVVVILYFAGLAVDDMAFQGRLVGVLLAIMAMNFAAMLSAGPIMRRVGMPVLQIVGWVFSALQAGLAMQILINALRHLVKATALLLGLVFLAAPAVAATTPCRPADSSRPGVGLVLSGGGARGAAHIGVLRVLEEMQIPIDCVAGTSMGAVVGGRIQSRAGAPLDLDQLRQDLGRVLEIGEFDRVDLDLAQHEDGVDLALRPHDNDWGPLYLRGGLNITDDLEGHNSVNLLFNMTRTSLNALGAEWRNEFQVGKTRGVWSELYQPLGFSQRWFAAAGIRLREEVVDIYSDHRKVAEYDVGSLSGRLDFGLELGEYGEVRVGLLRGRADAEPSVGATDLQTLDVDAGGFTGSLTIDRLDSAGVPREGELTQIEAYRTEPRLGSDLRYDKLAAYYWHFASKGRQTWLLALSGGSSLGSDLR